MELLNLGDFKRAEAELKRLRSEVSSDDRNYVDTCLAELGSRSRLASLSEELRRYPDDLARLLDRARLNASLGNLPSAISDLDRLIRLVPARADAYRLRAAFNESSGKYGPALDDYRRAAELDRGFRPEFGPAYASAFLDNGKKAFTAGDLQRSISELSEAIDRGSSDREALEMRGLARLRIANDPSHRLSPEERLDLIQLAIPDHRRLAEMPRKKSTFRALDSGVFLVGSGNEGLIAMSLYNLACCYSVRSRFHPPGPAGDAKRKEDLDRAFHYLNASLDDSLRVAWEKAQPNGQSVRALIEGDDDLVALRADPRFRSARAGLSGEKATEKPRPSAARSPP